VQILKVNSDERKTERFIVKLKVNICNSNTELRATRDSISSVRPNKGDVNEVQFRIRFSRYLGIMVYSLHNVPRLCLRAQVTTP
jgi:hypothetical protein